MKKKPTVIQGYTLIERKQAGEVMVVVGHNPKAASPYVTWKAYEHSGFECVNQDMAAASLGIVPRTMRRIKKEAVGKLAEMYAFAEDHRR